MALYQRLTCWCRGQQAAQLVTLAADVFSIVVLLCGVLLAFAGVLWLGYHLVVVVR